MNRFGTQDTYLESELIQSVFGEEQIILRTRTELNMSSRTYHASEVISVMAFVSVIYLYYIGLYSIVFVREPDPEEGMMNCLQASTFSCHEK